MIFRPRGFDSAAWEMAGSGGLFRVLRASRGNSAEHEYAKDAAARPLELTEEDAYRFVCCDGLVVGDICNDIRIPHKGNAQDEVIDGAFRVLDDFEAVEGSIDDMKAIPLKPEEQRAFATAVLTLRYGERTEGQAPAPFTAEQLDSPRRIEDSGDSL